MLTETPHAEEIIKLQRDLNETQKNYFQALDDCRQKEEVWKTHHVLPKHVCSIEKVKVFLKESSTFQELVDSLRKEGNGNGEGRGNGHGHGMVDVTEWSTSHPLTCQLLVDYAQMARPGFMFTSSL